MTSLRWWAYERDKAALAVVRCAVCLRYAAGVRFRIFCLSLIVINLQTKYGNIMSVKLGLSREMKNSASGFSRIGR